MRLGRLQAAAGGATEELAIANEEQGGLAFLHGRELDSVEQPKLITAAMMVPHFIIPRLLAHQTDAALPRNFAPPLSVVFTMYARPKDDPTTQRPIARQVDGQLRVELPARDAVFGTAQGEARSTLAGVQLEATATLGAMDPPPRDAVGEREVTFRFAYELRDARGTKRRADLQAKGTVLLDRGSVALRTLAMSVDPGIDVHAPPRAQTLPGTGPFASLDAYVGLDVRPLEGLGPTRSPTQ